MQLEGIDCLLLALDRREDPVDILEDITRYALLGFEEHVAVAQNAQLVAHIVCALKSDQASGGATVAAALDALKALAIAREGQKALIQNEACDALCSVISRTHARDTGHEQQACKRQRIEGYDELQPAVQALVTLLLESADRPAPGILSASSAMAAFNVLRQILHTDVHMSLDLQQAVAAVSARLAMEPSVQHLMFHAPINSGKHCTGQSQSTDSPEDSIGNTASSGTGLAALMGSQQAAVDFLCKCWESKPHAWSLPHQTQRQCQQETALNHGAASSAVVQQLHAEADAAGAARTSTSAEHGLIDSISANLTDAALFEELLPMAQHCPLMDFAETDPVQYLSEVYQQRHLLQPLQCNHDIRLIRAAPGHTLSDIDPAATAASVAPATTADNPAASDDATEQVLVLSAPVTAADIHAAVAKGFSLVVRDMPKRSRAVAALVESLEQQLGLPAGANLYYTPAGAQGLKVHYDDHCVFAIQLSGQKCWQVARPQHQQLPLTYTRRFPVSMPRQTATDGQQQTAEAPQQKVQQYLLSPGSCLYIPRGWVHEAVAPTAVQSCQVTAAADALATVAATQAPQLHRTGSQEQQADAYSRGQLGAEQDHHSVPAAVDANGSLHLSVGLEVEAWFSAQGFLHCLIQSSALQCMAECQTHGVQLAGMTAMLRPAAVALPAAGSNLWRLAYAAAALLGHLLLVQHANQRPVFRRACPVLVKDGQLRQLVAAAFAEQLDEAYRPRPSQHEQNHTNQQQNGQHLWISKALQYVLCLTGTPDKPNGNSLQSSFLQLNTALFADSGKLCVPEPPQQLTVPSPATGTSHLQDSWSQQQQARSSQAASTQQPNSMSNLTTAPLVEPHEENSSIANSTAGLPAVLEWIQRVSDTAGMLAEHRTGTVALAHSKDSAEAVSAAEGDFLLSAGARGHDALACAAPNARFDTGCRSCWVLAGHVLDACRSAVSSCASGNPLELPAGMPLAAAAAAKLMSITWAQVLERAACVPHGHLLELVYRKQAGRCIEARQLVRSAHMGVMQHC